MSHRVLHDDGTHALRVGQRETHADGPPTAATCSSVAPAALAAASAAATCATKPWNAVVADAITVAWLVTSARSWAISVSNVSDMVFWFLSSTLAIYAA